MVPHYLGRYKKGRLGHLVAQSRHEPRTRLAGLSQGEVVIEDWVRLLTMYALATATSTFGPAWTPRRHFHSKFQH